MKKTLITTLLASSIIASTSFASIAPSKTNGGDTNLVNQASYLMGYHLAAGLKTQGIPVNTQQLIAGIQDQMNNKPLTMPEQLQQKIMMEYQTLAQKKVQENMKAQGETNQTTGQAFLAKTAKEDGVKPIPNGNGVLYKVIKAGHGAKPKASDTVEVNYEGKLIDGKIFDSSYQRGTPATFGVNQVIKGWTVALEQMPVGSTWMLYIPADMAYGANGTPGGEIPPNSVLIFKVDLISIKK